MLEILIDLDLNLDYVFVIYAISCGVIVSVKLYNMILLLCIMQGCQLLCFQLFPPASRSVKKSPASEQLTNAGAQKKPYERLFVAAWRDDFHFGPTVEVVCHDFIAESPIRA